MEYIGGIFLNKIPLNCQIYKQKVATIQKLQYANIEILSLVFMDLDHRFWLNRQSARWTMAKTNVYIKLLNM